MIAEFNNMKFRVGLVSNYDIFPKMDYQLFCINEEYSTEWDKKIIPHEKFKEAVKQNKIKLII